MSLRTKKPKITRKVKRNRIRILNGLENKMFYMSGF